MPHFSDFGLITMTGWGLTHPAMGLGE